MTRYCFALDLHDDPALIAEYEEHHRNIWPEVAAATREQGITTLEIYRSGNRLFMILEADESFSFEKKQAADRSNETLQEWEQLMWKFQQALPWAKPGEKWVLMDRIFEL